MQKNTHITIFLLFVAVHCFALQNLVLESKSATALNTVTLYPDSSFFKHSNIVYQEGALFELIGESKQSHEDDAQKQKFKWYKVKSPDGNIGWIFGDGLAVIKPDHALDTKWLPFHKKRVNFGNGFEHAVTWIASVDGHDNIHTQTDLNPVYSETYLVLTNKRGKSIHINIASDHVRGKSTLTELRFLDITQDGFPEILLEKTSNSVENTVPHQNLEIYTAQAGTLTQILDEHLSLAYEDDLRSPALNKFVEVEKNLVRVEYIAYMDCADYRQPVSPQAVSKSMERCMEYVTYTYIWNTRKKTMERLYDESRTMVSALCKYDGYLQAEPSIDADDLARVYRSEKISVIKHFEKSILRNGQKMVEYYFLVQTSTGAVGYLPASDVHFYPFFHSAVLNRFYKEAPIRKNDWTYDITFINIK